MDNNLDYAWEKFVAAANTLAAGTGSLRERLVDAYRGQAFRADGFTPPLEDQGLRDRMLVLHQEMTHGDPVADEGTIAASINAMTEEQLQHEADEIFSIAIALTRHLGAQDGAS